MDWEYYRCPHCSGLEITIVKRAIVESRQECHANDLTYRISSMNNVSVDREVLRLVCRTCGAEADGPSSYWGQGREVSVTW